MKTTQFLFWALASLAAAVPCPLAAKTNPAGIPVGGTEAFPVKILIERADLQLMAYFCGNPDFCAIEAWVHTAGFPPNIPAIRVILTKPNGDQEDYINYTRRTGLIHNDNGRELYSTPISLKGFSQGRDWLLSLTLQNGQACQFYYSGTGDPDAQWGGLTDPGNHSLHTAIPMMYREKSGMGDEKSYVRFGSHQYTVDLDKAAW